MAHYTLHRVQQEPTPRVAIGTATTITKSSNQNSTKTHRRYTNDKKTAAPQQRYLCTNELDESAFQRFYASYERTANDQPTDVQRTSKEQQTTNSQRRATNDERRTNQRTNEKVPHVPNVPTFQRSNGSTLTDRPTKRTNERTTKRTTEHRLSYRLLCISVGAVAVGGGQWAVGSLLSVAIADEGLH